MTKIRTECPSCKGTGLYQGFMEQEGEAVVCVTCSGRGYKDLEVKEFTGRKKLKNVSKIRTGTGSIIDAAMRQHKWITYEEFEKDFPA